ncbi:CPBP family intramembrane glutamic endopeptidase [Bacillus sp. JJ1773]|uniref:CPBP family intramembrane glutamic endopeptidase n=1 Tax=Bacillus sp. JJ1773 TaxID=3122965 RepID=UPI002FFEE921
MQIINSLITAILQVSLLSIIPFIWWLIFGRKETSFFRWVGFKKPIIHNKRKYVITFIATIIFLSIPSFIIIPYFVDQSVLATAQFSGKGIDALIPALIYAFLQTGLSEEVFFRGFLMKRLVHKFGLQVGNGVQSLLFGLLHGIFLFSYAGFWGAVIITLITGIAGWLMGWLNEKQSEGSIVSSWLLHGCANTLASIIVMFNIL